MSNISLSIKGQVTTRQGTHYWSVRTPDGILMAAGEERRLGEAVQNTYDTVSAIRAWIMFGRGDLRVRTKYLEASFKPQQRGEI
jgi:hypothetical protein